MANFSNIYRRSKNASLHFTPTARNQLREIGLIVAKHSGSSCPRPQYRIVTGKPSGLLDVDLDCEAAVTLG